MKTWTERRAQEAADMEIGGQLEAAKRCLAAARNAEAREVRQALARCAERYILGALGYERTGSGAAQERAAPSPCPALAG